MGKLNIFEISFNNIQGVYYAGQNVQGHCTVELNEEMAMRGIRLKFLGQADVYWTETETRGTGDDQRTVTESYSAKEKYFEQEVLLFGIWPAQGRDTVKLSAGRTVFPFCFVLPPNLPSSFEGSDGHVRYSVKGIIDKPWKFDHTTKRPFSIISILDLNADPSAMMPVDHCDEKTICCLCCASGPITASFHLERRGYVPGEVIRLFADIRNKSSRKIDKSYVDLKMVTVYHATTKSKTVAKEIGRVVEGPILEGQSFSWEGQEFVIPPLPPSHLGGCKIIDIKYILQLNVDPSGPALDLEVPLEIIIGTIPLRQVVQQHPPRVPPPLQPSFGFHQPTSGHYAGASSQPLDPSVLWQPVMPSNIPNMPPPSYSECVLGKVNVKDAGDSQYTRGVLEFAPVYTYYDWGHQPTTMSGK